MCTKKVIFSSSVWLCGADLCRFKSHTLSRAVLRKFYQRNMMEDLHEKRKLEQNLSELNVAEKRQSTDDSRTMTILNRPEQEIFGSVSATTVSMGCPPEKVGPLIGRKGIVVQEIMRRSTCRIYVDQNYPEGHPRQIQITGHPKDLGIAIALVSLVMEHGPSIISPVVPQPRETPAPDSADITDSEFICPQAKVGALIGSKGSNVHEIFNRTGCRVQVLQDGVPDGMDRKVSFTGTPQQIQEAKVLVTQLITTGAFEINPTPQNAENSASNNATASALLANPNAKTVETDVSPDKVRLVIGARGVTIGEIMKRSGCKVFINQNFPEGQPHKVVYTGTAQQIDIAKYLVDTVVTQGMSALYSILNGTESIVIQEVNIYESQAVRLAENIVNDIQTRCAVKLNFDSSTTESNGTIRLSILGKVESVHAAIKMIYQIIGPPASESNTTVEILSSFQPQSSGPILALGKDGTSGHLESAFSLPDGSHQQVAEINNEVMGRIVGARSATLALIKSKSGANLQVLKSDHTKGTTRVVLAGTAHSVTLAAQMVQEVLVNGTGKLLKMPDAPSNLKPAPMMHHEGDGMNYFNPSAGGHQSTVHPPFYSATSIPIYPSMSPQVCCAKFESFPS